MATKCETWSAELVALKAKTAGLTNAFNSASVSVIGYINGFINGFGQYNCGEDLNQQAVALKNGISADNPNSATFLTSAVNVVQMNSGSCKGGSTNCSKEGCISAVGSVNIGLTNYFNSRKALVQNLLDIQNKESQIANDAECKAAQNQQSQQNVQDQEKNRQIRNGVIWFIVVSSVIGVLLYLDKKYTNIVLK